MEFLTEYGLFIAKTITLLIALLIAVVIIASATGKNRKGDDDVIEIEKINERFDDYKHLMASAVLDEETQKAQNKQEKKQKKLDKKAQKAAAKQNAASDKTATEQATESTPAKKRIFLASFDGDVKASEVDGLRKLITAILTEATDNDEVVINLESPGGMVHSYGLAASQLSRIRSKNIPLTVCVDKVAASGGYMMACVADKIIAAPFAIIGSIGVIAQLPNFHKLLKKNDVDYEMYTAGEYKRTVTMFGENTEKGREKFVAELEDTHELFKDYVSENRPVVDIADVATGEIWFGRRALDKQLIDVIQTSDEYLFEQSKEYDIYELSISPKQTLAEKLGLSVSRGIEQGALKVMQALTTRYYS